VPQKAKEFNMLNQNKTPVRKWKSKRGRVVRLSARASRVVENLSKTINKDIRTSFTTIIDLWLNAYENSQKSI
jgi:hypothetical protein